MNGTADDSRLENLFDSIPAMVAVVDGERRYRHANRPFCQALGRVRAEVVGRRVAEVLSEEMQRALDPPAGVPLVSGDDMHVEGWHESSGQGRRYLHRTYIPRQTPDGRPDGYVLFILDITDPHRREQALRQAEAFKTAIINGALDCIVTVDGGGRIIGFNPAAEQTFGRSRESVLGRMAIDVIVPAEARDRHRGAFGHHHGQGARIGGQRQEILAMRADGSCFPAEMAVTEATIDGRLMITAYLRDVSERARLRKELEELAYQDPLTGMPNRLQLLREIAESVRRGQRDTLVIIDIDRFTSILTSFGQDFADSLLLGLAERLESARGPGDRLARVGDRSFALLLTGGLEREQVARRVDDITTTFRSAVTRSGAAVVLTTSVGVVMMTEDHVRAEDVLRDAEIATSRARDAGGAGQVWFDRAMHNRIIDQVRTEHDLRQALERDGELWLAYQPIIEMVTGRLAGFEALVRWTHPQRGSIPPVAFVPIAEETGLIVALDNWVLRTACKQIARWQALRDPDTAPLFMSVNLSPRELDQPEYLERVKAVLRESEVEATWLKMEVTEGAVMQRPEDSLKVLRGIKQLGIRLSIDDFGTGYSSLSYLTKFPFDSLKVDRSFVNAMHQSEENRAMVRIIIDLARLLGFDVIAEGIETQEDANLLRALACDYAQGYFYSRPIPPGEAETLVCGTLPWRAAEQSFVDDDYVEPWAEPE